MVKTHVPLRNIHFGRLGPLFEQTRLTDRKAMLQTKFQASEPNSSGEEDFLENFTFEATTPWDSTILVPEIFI